MKVNENLCFVCQEREPTMVATRDETSYKVCNKCAEAVKRANDGLKWEELVKK